MPEKQILAKKTYVDNSLDNVLRDVDGVVSIPNTKVELSQKIVTTTEEEITTDEVVTESYLNKTKLHVEDSSNSKVAEYGINEIVLNGSTITGITDNASGNSSTLAVSQRALSNFKQVEANPIDAPTANLTTIKIDNTIYELDAGTNVSITPTITEGTKIADFEIDGVQGSLFAPEAAEESTFGVYTVNSLEFFNEEEDNYFCAQRLFNDTGRNGVFANEAWYQKSYKGLKKFLEDKELTTENLVIMYIAYDCYVIWKFSDPVKVLASRYQYFMFTEDSHTTFDRYLLSIDASGNYTETNPNKKVLNEPMAYISQFNVYATSWGAQYSHLQDAFKADGGWTTVVTALTWSGNSGMTWNYGYDWASLLFSSFPVYSPYEARNDSGYRVPSSSGESYVYNTVAGYQYILNTNLASYEWTDFRKHVIWYTADGYKEHTSENIDPTEGDFVGATTTTNGKHGYVPAPKVADKDKVLKGDGTWGEAGSNVSITPSLATGAKIADYNIDGVSGSLYAPQDGGSSIDYSTTEQDTGIKWIDGSPIYQKTIALNNTIYNGTLSGIPHNITNLSQIISFNVNFFDTNPASDREWTKGVIQPPMQLRANATNLYFYSTYSGDTYSWDAETSRTWYITLQYTKSTN